jgi:ankyrin repeat protein
LKPLLAAGADPFRRNEQGHSALSLAEIHNPDMVANLHSHLGLRLPLLD